MTHEELLAKINKDLEIAEFEDSCGDGGHPPTHRALRAVVELHREDFGTPGDDPLYTCDYCKLAYPCLTIQAIEKELE